MVSFQPKLDARQQSLRLMEWILYEASHRGLTARSWGITGDAVTPFGVSTQFTIGHSDGTHITVTWEQSPGRWTFQISDQSKSQELDEVVNAARTAVNNFDFGQGVVCYTSLQTIEDILSPTGQLQMARRLGDSRVIQGKLRLGDIAVLDFHEEPSADGTFMFTQGKADVYLYLPGPVLGPWSIEMGNQIIQIVRSIAVFAWGRPVVLTPGLFAAKDDILERAQNARADPGLLHLARNHIPLNIFAFLHPQGRTQTFEKLQGALMSYEAAISVMV